MTYQFPISKIAVSNVTPTKVLDGFVAPCGTPVTLRNVGSTPVFLGQSGVDSSSGFTLSTGTEISMVLTANEATDLYALASNSPGVVVVFIGRAVNV